MPNNTPDFTPNTFIDGVPATSDQWNHLLQQHLNLSGVNFLAVENDQLGPDRRLPPRVQAWLQLLIAGSLAFSLAPTAIAHVAEADKNPPANTTLSTADNHTFAKSSVISATIATQANTRLITPPAGCEYTPARFASQEHFNPLAIAAYRAACDGYFGFSALTTQYYPSDGMPLIIPADTIAPNPDTPAFCGLINPGESYLATGELPLQDILYPFLSQAGLQAEGSSLPLSAIETEIVNIAAAFNRYHPDATLVLPEFISLMSVAGRVKELAAGRLNVRLLNYQSDLNSQQTKNTFLLAPQFGHNGGTVVAYKNWSVVQREDGSGAFAIKGIPQIMLLADTDPLKGAIDLPNVFSYGRAELVVPNGPAGVCQPIWVQIGPDGQVVATATGQGEFYNPDGTINNKIWQLAEGMQDELGSTNINFETMSDQQILETAPSTAIILGSAESPGWAVPAMVSALQRNYSNLLWGPNQEALTLNPYDAKPLAVLRGGETNQPQVSDLNLILYGFNDPELSMFAVHPETKTVYSAIYIERDIGVPVLFLDDPSVPVENNKILAIDPKNPQLTLDNAYNAVQLSLAKMALKGQLPGEFKGRRVVYLTDPERAAIDRITLSSFLNSITAGKKVEIKTVDNKIMTVDQDSILIFVFVEIDDFNYDQYYSPGVRPKPLIADSGMVGFLVEMNLSKAKKSKPPGGPVTLVLRRVVDDFFVSVANRIDYQLDSSFDFTEGIAYALNGQPGRSPHLPARDQITSLIYGYPTTTWITGNNLDTSPENKLRMRNPATSYFQYR